MREIKFRAWDSETNKMWHPDIIDIKTGRPGIIMSKRNAFTYDCPLMQYTGLKDRNGKEIYEGDVIGGCGMKAEVFWDDKRASYRFRWIGENARVRMYNTREESMFLNTPVVFEVIGNIYENPDLIERKG